MPFTDDYDLELPSDGVKNTGTSINANTQKIADGRTAKETLGEAINEHEVGAIDTATGKIILADASVVGTTYVIGFCTQDGILDDERHFKNSGFVDNAGWALSRGPVYLSDTAGDVSNTPGTIPIFLGIAVSATKIRIIGLSGVNLGTGAGGQTDTVTGSNGITNAGDNVDADLTPTYGNGANEFCEGNDARLSDSRTPTAHAASHKNGGSDEILLNEFGEPTGTVNMNDQEVQNIGRINYNQKAQTISSDSFTMADDASWYQLAGEGAAADNLQAVEGGNAGDILILQGGANAITIKENTGGGTKFFMRQGSDRILVDEADIIVFYNDGDWYEAVCTSVA